MNYGEMVTFVRSQIQEPVSRFWTEDDVSRAINQGDLQVCATQQLGDVYRTVDGGTVVDQKAYDLPKYVFCITDVLYGDSERPLDSLPDRPDLLETTSGTPRRFWLPHSAKKMYLDPAPDTAGEQIKIVGRFKSADMASDSDEPEAPASLHLAVCYWAIMQLWMKRKDQHEVGMAMQIYMTIMNDIDGDTNATGPMMIVRRVNRGGYM